MDMMGFDGCCCLGGGGDGILVVEVVGASPARFARAPLRCAKGAGGGCLGGVGIPLLALLASPFAGEGDEIPRCARNDKEYAWNGRGPPRGGRATLGMTELRLRLQGACCALVVGLFFGDRALFACERAGLGCASEVSCGCGGVRVAGVWMLFLISCVRWCFEVSRPVGAAA